MAPLLINSQFFLKPNLTHLSQFSKMLLPPCSPRRPLLICKTHQILLLLLPSLVHSQQNNFSYYFFKKTLPFSHMACTKKQSSSLPTEEEEESERLLTQANEAISLEEWQRWGSISAMPLMVNEVIQDLKLLEKDTHAHMTFGGNHGKLSGDFKVKEDKKHRAKYASLSNSEEKIRFFSARQIACRLLGSRGYLCQKCWLPSGDCMCLRVTMCSLWNRVRIWLYMHPKDFLRQNNTGKLLWQVFGVHAATLCLFGIAEHEEMMWNEFSRAGRNKVGCLYPNRNAATESVKDCADQYLSGDLESQAIKTNGDKTVHFILIDGTWSNSAAMFRRLQDRAELEWGQGLRCISLNTGVSSMHKLRPQPSWDRTCTAAAAMGLLYELHQLPPFNSVGLDKQAEAIESALEILLEALTTRRLRMGRSISRKVRHHNDVC